MTYCLAIKGNDGFICAADTRTNAGVDYVTVYPKLHVFDAFDDRVFVLLTAGNLGISQEVCYWLQRDLGQTGPARGLASVKYSFEAADYVGRVLREIIDRHASGMQSSGTSADTTLILAGQIRGEPHEIFMIYPEGNFISTSEETPYLQIGENKYGKPVLDRLVTPALSLADAARLALVSLEATVRSNVTVGMPFDLAVYAKDSLNIRQRVRFHQHSAFLAQLQAVWQQGLAETFGKLPQFDWEGDDAPG